MYALLPLMLLFFLVLAAPAQAVPCGSGQTHEVCQCGDTVMGHYTMPASLFCSTGHGLRVATGATLNCAWNAVVGQNLPDTYGVYFDMANLATVKNCWVGYFGRGVRFNGAYYNTLTSVVSTANGDLTNHPQGGYGIDVAGASGSNVIGPGVTVYGNADEGIHIGEESHNNTVYLSEACGNFRENLYVVGNYGTQVSWSQIGHDCYGSNSGGNAAYVKDATATWFIEALVRKHDIHVTGSSAWTTIWQSSWQTQGTPCTSGNGCYKEDCYTGPGDGCPSDTTFVP